jgi:UDP-N-acetyl-D-mannosaminuronic acid dehydrogenase
MVELVQNDRIVGGLSDNATKEVGIFYRTFVSGDVLETDASTAEMCKLAENSFRDVNIAFANELSILCTNAGVNVQNLIKLANHHPRVSILQPGVGVGGHCIAVDPWFIVARDPDNAKLIRVAREVNNAKANWVIKEITEKLSALSIQLHRNPRLVCLGLAFKPDIDDLRESPALQIVLSLHSRGYDIKVVEPNIEGHEFLNLVELEASLPDADIVAVLVKHKEFAGLVDSGLVKKESILDFCGLD